MEEAEDRNLDVYQEFDLFVQGSQCPVTVCYRLDKVVDSNRSVGRLSRTWINTVIIDLITFRCFDDVLISR